MLQVYSHSHLTGDQVNPVYAPTPKAVDAYGREHKIAALLTRPKIDRNRSLSPVEFSLVYGLYRTAM